MLTLCPIACTMLAWKAMNYAGSAKGLDLLRLNLQNVLALREMR
jgi:hypothetical protein